MLQKFKSLSAVPLSFIFILSAATAYGQDMQMNKDSAANNNGAKQGETEIPHPFFTHMGMPEGKGMYSLRSNALATNDGGKTTGDFAFHFETGLTKNLGLHIRNDRFLYNTHTEIMLQFAVIRSKDGQSGFAPLIEFEIPTKKGASRINTLVGFTTAIVKSRFTFNQALHYNPREDMVDGSVAFVVAITNKLFFVAEALGVKPMNASAVVNLLGGIKFRVNNNIVLGLGYQAPVTRNKNFTSQYIFQPETEWKSGSMR